MLRKKITPPELKKHHKQQGSVPPRRHLMFIILDAALLLIMFVVLLFAVFEARYENKVYPSVNVGGIPFGGKTADEVRDFWLSKNEPFTQSRFEFIYGTTIATVSGSMLDLGYDATISASQAYAIGRSGNILSDIRQQLFEKRIDLTPYFRYRKNLIEEILDTFSASIDTEPQDALFTFTDGKVTAFKPSSDGRKLDRAAVMGKLTDAIANIPKTPIREFTIELTTLTIKPSVSTDNANSFGIKELIGTGYSVFPGSIQGRIHNVALASARFNGVLIPPGATFSFNKTLGDVSAATGYQPAYIIKEGRTILGDGGGVCQVSTTLFRAAMNAGLPIIERHAHAYRVHYYEDGGFKAGLDATVFDPSADLVIKNDTPAYILIQTIADTQNMNLTFNLYGTPDGRKAELFGFKMWDVSPPPPDLYQDDPTLKVGVVKQVDWAAWGAKASFEYKVTRGDEKLIEKTFTSVFRPWQAVYLKGTMP